jgi:hypothetical protein
MMQFLMTMPMLMSLPLLAQVSPLVPLSSMNVREMVAPAAPAASGVALGDKSPAVVPGRAMYRWSVAALVAANALDVASSWKGREINPVVGGSTGQFGIASVAIKSGLVTTALVIQHISLRHHPERYKQMAWTNFVVSGFLGAVAIHNEAIQ